MVRKDNRNGGHKAAKIEIRVAENDRVAIGVTLTYDNWESFKIIVMQHEPYLSKRRNDDNLIVACPHGESVHVYNYAKGNIFGITLQKDVVEKLVEHMDSMKFFKNLSLFGELPMVEKLALNVMAMVLHSLVKREMSKNCIAYEACADMDCCETDLQHS